MSWRNMFGLSLWLALVIGTTAMMGPPMGYRPMGAPPMRSPQMGAQPMGVPQMGAPPMGVPQQMGYRPMGLQSMGPQSAGTQPMGGKPMLPQSCQCFGGACAQKPDGTNYCVCFPGYSLSKDGTRCLKNPNCPYKPCQNGVCHYTYWERQLVCICDKGYELSPTDPSVCLSPKEMSVAVAKATAASSVASAPAAQTATAGASTATPVSTPAPRRCSRRRCRNGSCQPDASGVSKCVCDPGYTLNPVNQRCEAEVPGAAAPPAPPGAAAPPPPSDAAPPPPPGAAPGAASAASPIPGSPAAQNSVLPQRLPPAQQIRGAIARGLDIDPLAAAVAMNSQNPQQAALQYYLLGELK